MEPQSVFFTLPGLRMHALELGTRSDKPVVLLHGFPEYSGSWTEVMPALAARGFRVIAPDLRGYGQTERPPHGYDLDTLAADIAALIDQLGGRAHLVGHDWGGAIAYYVAARYPERVERLSVVNCPHPLLMLRKIRSPAQLRRSWYIFFFQLPLLPEWLLSRKGGERVIQMLQSAAVDQTRLTPERLAPFAENFATRAAVHAGLAYYRQIFRAVFRRAGRQSLATFPKIAAPFRLIWGEEDVALGRDMSLGLEPFFSGPHEVCYLPGVGHFGPIEAPEKIAALLVEHFTAAL